MELVLSKHIEENIKYSLINGGKERNGDTVLMRVRQN